MDELLGTLCVYLVGIGTWLLMGLLHWLLTDRDDGEEEGPGGGPLGRP